MAPAPAAAQSEVEPLEGFDDDDDMMDDDNQMVNLGVDGQSQTLIHRGLGTVRAGDGAPG